MDVADRGGLGIPSSDILLWHSWHNYTSMTMRTYIIRWQGNVAWGEYSRICLIVRFLTCKDCSD